MLTFTEKILENLSNKVSTLNFSEGPSNLLVPTVNINDMSKNSNITKSFNGYDNEYSVDYDTENYSSIE